MYKNLTLVILLTLALLSVAQAVPDSAIIGGYNISFDLGMPKTAYDKQMTDPVSTESLGGDKRVTLSLKLENKTDDKQILSLRLTTYESGVPPYMAGLMPEFIEKILTDVNVRNVETTKRVIDGVDGGIGKGVMRVQEGPFDVYAASYVLPFDQNSTAYFVSTFPWDDGSLSFLKTLHVERINATS